MNKEYTAKIITTMKRRITNWRFLLKVNFSKDDMVNLISSKEFYHIMLSNIDSNDYSCEALRKAYEVIYQTLFDDEMDESFLRKAYQFTLSKSFPDAVVEDLSGDLRVYEIFLELLKVYSSFQKTSKDQTFLSVYPFEMLSKNEIYALEDQSEYSRFKDAFETQYIYEMMKLNYEVTGHSTIEHILGVHYLALKIARQLKAIGVNIDLGRVSGAAAGHDIGKFGCRPEEDKKIAYYHYYYTDEWFKSLNIQYIKNVAVYHSTWDLELESLSIESLVLIYSDFCVKRSKDKLGLFKMKYLTVDESFKVILAKLDNVDEIKKKRYERVYQKLKNFFEYLEYQGVDCYVENYNGGPLNHEHFVMIKDYSTLDTGKRVIDHLKNMAIEKSVELMHRLRHIDSSNEIIQEAISEKDIQMLRRYLFIFEEYSTYLTPEQKLNTIEFLKSYMIHSEEDIRKESSRLIGKLIADYDENYTKELPARANVTYTVETKYKLVQSLLNQFVFHDVRMTPVKRQRQVSSFHHLLKSLYCNEDEDFRQLLTDMLVGYYHSELDEYGLTFMLEVIDILPNETMSSHLEIILEFLVSCITKNNKKMIAYTQLNNLMRTEFKTEMVKLLDSKFDINSLLKGANETVEIHLLKPILEAFSMSYITDVEEVKSEMFLSNLKSATPKSIKIAQIEMLYNHAMAMDTEEKFYTAMHFCNILKVSEYEVVRNKAGNCLLLLFEKLSSEQKNDIVIELIRALEIEGYGFTRYIPSYLGQLIPTLSSKEYHEILHDIVYKIKNASINIRVLLLDTVGSMIKKWLVIGEKDHIEALLGCIFNGFYSGNKLTTQMAFNVISKEVIGNKKLDLTDRAFIFSKMYMKLHVFLMDSDYFELDLFNYSVGLHYIYHFITDYNYFKGDLKFESCKKVAFYSGTFDPFSLGQKSAAVDANSLGFEVFISISEFQWRRRTQPSLMRKRIVDMSISDQMSIYTFPQSMPINLNLAEDHDKLRQFFESRDVYLIIGEEALLKDPKYRDLNHDIYNFSHIIYKRDSFKHSVENKKLIEERLSNMKADTISRSLEYRYEMIDVNQIRRNIDKNWDAFDVIDDLATKYIKYQNLYKNEPQFKSTVDPSDVEIITMPLKKYDTLQQLSEQFDISYENLQHLQEGKHYDEDQPSLDRQILLVVESSTKKVLAFSIYARARPMHLFGEIKSLEILKDISEKSCEYILIIDELIMKPYEKIHALDQIVLTETLTHEIRNGYQYAVIKCVDPHKMSKDINGVIIRSGFIEYRCTYSDKLMFAADMREPVVINLDGTTRMKTDYRSNNHIRDTIKFVRTNLQQAVVDLYPGCLVLSFDRSMMYNHLIRLVTKKNGVEFDSDQLGQSMCVPYGDVFKRWLLPNTVTKAFHTERYYGDDIARYEVYAYPGYLSILEQARILKAYNMPLILVDDLVDKGNRLHAINKYLISESIPVQEVIVGILSGRGKKLFNSEGMTLSSAYFIPKIKVWFNESDVYPFIGGDSVKRESTKNAALPSVNLMLPFVYPKYIKTDSKEALYRLSLVCLENAIVILTEIEKVYAEINNRVLSVEQMKEVMITPRIPDVGAHMYYDMNYKPTDFLENELIKLKKMKHAFKDTI